jgi:hypothetical protein
MLSGFPDHFHHKTFEYFIPAFSVGMLASLNDRAMEKRKKSKRRRFLGLTIGELCAVATLVLTMCGLMITGVHYFDTKFARIDYRFGNIERRLDSVEGRLHNIETDLRKTSDLLDLYLTWRFIYINDPMKKNLVPVYDPRTRTLGFVSKNK